MKNKDLEFFIKDELNNIRIPMSRKILETPIELSKAKSTASHLKYKPPFYKSWKLLSSAICSLILIFTIAFVVNINSTTASCLTCYTLEINPAVTLAVDDTNEILSVCSLNEDGDTLLNDEDLSDLVGSDFFSGMEMIFDVSFKQGFIDTEQDHLVRLFVLNNSADYARRCLNTARAQVDNYFEENNFENVACSGYLMNMDEYKFRMGFNSSDKDLDKMREQIMQHNMFFNPESHPLYV